MYRLSILRPVDDPPCSSNVTAIRDGEDSVRRFAVSSFDRRCQGAGKISGCPRLRSRVDSRPGDEVEGRRVLNMTKSRTSR